MAGIQTLAEPEARERPPARPVPHLYVALDCDAPLRPPRRHCLAATHQVLLGRGEGPAATRSGPDWARVLALEFQDRWMSGRHATLRRADGRWLLEDLQSRNGVRLNGERVPRAELKDGDVFELGHTFFVFREAVALGPPDVVAGAATRTLVPELEAQLARLAVVAPAGVPVMLRGETGVGKEVAARLAHQLSGRSGPFVPVNCGALPRELVASELFGHQKGAFTGATEAQPGLVRSAHQGTLFLDEVGELPLAAQPVLLRMLQEREVTPVGGTRPVPVDVLLVTATHRDLQQLSEAGDFREDLLARLAGFTLELPPLRERREDLGLLVGALLARLGAASLTLSPEAARALFAAPWPRNVRELEKALQVGAALAEGGVLEREHLPEAARTPAQPEALEPEAAELKRQLIELLEVNQGNVTAVARTLGKARTQVQRWLKRFGLDPERYR